MKLILLNGSSCSGKSTLIKHLMKERDDFFQLSYDSIKWLFSKYAYTKQGRDVQKVMFAIAGSVFKMHYYVVCDSFKDKKLRQKLIALAKKNGYKIIEINLEADYDVLSKRFDERVKRALADPESKIANTSKERFKQLHDNFHAEKNPKAMTFRTDKQTPEQIYKKISKLI